MAKRDGAGAHYDWDSSAPAHNHRLIRPAIVNLLQSIRAANVLDLGCGNGSLTAAMSGPGRSVVGVDASAQGIAEARRAFPSTGFRVHDLGESLPSDLHGAFDAVVAAEVIEHLLLPRQLLRRAQEALPPGGRLVLTTPFHGYWKNLALALSGRFDEHWRPTWDYGHVKFFSRRTLTTLLEDSGFVVESFSTVGRVPPLATSMIMSARVK